MFPYKQTAYITTSVMHLSGLILIYDLKTEEMLTKAMDESLICLTVRLKITRSVQFHVKYNF